MKSNARNEVLGAVNDILTELKRTKSDPVKDLDSIYFRSFGDSDVGDILIFVT